MKISSGKRLAAILIVAVSAALPAWGQPAGNQEAENEKPPERLIYIPFKDLKSVFEKPDGSVLVPYNDYIKLWEKAFGGSTKPDPRNANAVISSADYTVKIEQDVARITCALVAQSLEKGWTEIPIKFGEAAIGKLTSDSGKVLLRGAGTGSYVLLLPSKGEHKIQLEITARVRNAPEGKSLELDIPAVGITNFELAVPEADQTIELKPKLVTQPIEVAAKESKVKASIGATEKISVRWFPRVGTKPEMELLASVTNQTLVTIEDGLIHTDAWLNYEILRGQLDKVKLVVPKGHRILDITSAAKVKEWKSAEEEGRQVVSVELLGRAEGKVTIEVHTERSVPTEAFDVAGQEGNQVFGVHALGVVRESGTVAVKAGGDITLTVEEQQGLSRTDEVEIDPKLKRPGALYYKYYSPVFRLKVLSKPVQPRLIVDHQSQLVFREDQLRLRSNLTYTIDRAGLFEVKFKLPDNLTIENVVCDRMKQFDVSADKKSLTVSLREKTQGNVALVISATRPLDPASEKTDQSLPLLEPVDVEVENGKVQVYAPDAIDVITDSERLQSVQPDPAPQPEAIANVRLVSSWVYSRRPVEIPVRTVRKPTRLTALIGTKAEVKQGQIVVTTNLNYLIEYAGFDTFRFAVPEAVADKVQITSKGGPSAPAIKQKNRAAAAVDGWVTWTVVMQRDVTGSQPFEISYDAVPATGPEANRQSATIEILRVLDPYDKTDGPQGKRNITVSRTIGEITVVKDRALSVSASASGGDVEQIDVRELQQLTQDGIVAFRYFKDPVKLELTSNRYDVQKVFETVVSKSLVEIVLDRAGVAINRGRYVLKSSERQRLRVDLPANVEVLGVLVDRKPTALEKAGFAAEKGWDAYFVNVARTKSSDEPFTISVVFRHALQQIPFQNAGGALELRLPIIGDQAATGVAVQQLQVKVWVPPEYTLVSSPKNFTAQTKTRMRALMLGSSSPVFGEQDLDAWIGHDTGGVFDFPTEGNRFQYMNLGGAKVIKLSYWHLPFYTAVVSGALVLIALVLRNTSWENKLSLAVLALFAICAFALRDRDLVFNGMHVAIYGIVALVAIWLLHGILGPRSVVKQPEVLVPPPAAPAAPIAMPPAEPPPAGSSDDNPSTGTSV